MQTRQLGNSDLQITPLGIGAWAIGGGGVPFAWGPQDDNDSIGAIHAALDRGINWIDTAPVYGLGHSEEIVGRALQGRANRPYVFTKCSIVWDDKREPSRSMKRDSIRGECEESLRRLRIDAIDLYQIHWPDPEPGIEEGWAAVAELQKEGKVRWIGVSNFKPAHMDRIQPIAPITSLQPPYSILSPEIEPEILPYCARHNIGVIVYSPMKSGLLTGAMTRERIAQMPEDDFRQRTISFKEPLADAQSESGRADAGNRQPAWPHSGRSGAGVDAAPSRSHRRDCRPALGRSRWMALSARPISGSPAAKWKRSPDSYARTPRAKRYSG